MSESPSTLNILLVDDDEDQRRTLSTSLCQRGHRVRSVPDGLQGLLYLDEAVDLLISDIQMPGLDGLQLLRALRERFPDLPVILVTGDGSLDTAVAARRDRAHDYLEKPIQLEELLACIRRVGALRTPW